MQKRAGILILLGMLPAVPHAGGERTIPAAAHRNDLSPGPAPRYERPSYRGTLPRASPSPAYLPNFHYVDEHVYRGAQPAPNGWNALARLGVTLVIDLRPDGELGEHWTRSEQEAVEAAGMRYVNVPMSGWTAPDPEQISRILSILQSGQRVFVHCRSGKDRTGTVIACYRMAHDHWTNKRAALEATSLGMRQRKAELRQYILSFRP